MNETVSIGMGQYAIGDLVGAPRVSAITRHSLTYRHPVSCTYQMSSGVCLDKSYDGSVYQVLVGDRVVTYPRYMLTDFDDITSTDKQHTFCLVQEWMKQWM